MLDKSKLLYLNSNQKFSEIFDIFEKEYIQMICDFLDKKRYSIYKKWTNVILFRDS